MLYIKYTLNGIDNLKLYAELNLTYRLFFLQCQTLYKHGHWNLDIRATVTLTYLQYEEYLG